MEERELRVLIVEDDPDDAELVLRRLGRAGFSVHSQRVQDAEGLHDAIAHCDWDIVLADYNLPGFSGLEALRIVRSCGLDIPLVLVSGAIDVPTALEAMKAGARDFVLKDDTQRLPRVVEREMAEAEQRRQRRIAETQRDAALGELQAANMQLTAFVQLADVPLHGTSRDELVRELLERLLIAVDAEGAGIMLRDQAGFTPEQSVGLGSEVTTWLRADTAAVSTAVSENRIVYVHDVSVDSAVPATAIRESGMRSVVLIPMHFGGQVVGLLHLCWASVVNPPEWQLSLLEIAADRCAMALENARVFEHEHHIANTLQQALLSASMSIPDVEMGHFYASATEQTLVGGDFYDVFEVAPGQVAFSIGDVSGKGLEAASVTGLVKNTIRALAVDGHTPDAVMAKCNKVVSRFTNAETFVTAIFGILDTTERTLTYCTAGHLPPALVGEDGVRLLEMAGPLLGSLPDAKYVATVERFEDAESIVLYTDGLTEARSSDGTFFGEERLIMLLGLLSKSAPQDVAARLFEEAWHFSGGRLRDDVAVLVLRPRQAHTS